MATKTWVIYAEYCVDYEGDTLIGLYHPTDEGWEKAKRECEKHREESIEWTKSEYQTEGVPFEAVVGNKFSSSHYYLCCVEVT